MTPRVIDLVGKKFGRLLVLSLESKKRSRSGTVLYWKCLCDCGTEVVILGNGLKNGDSLSCGCLRKDVVSKRRLVNLIGEIFGYLTVIARDDDYVRPGNKGHNARWICKCRCGNRKSIVGSTLISGITVSCGCLSESLVASELKKYCVNKHKANETENRDFINPETGYPLPFDIYIPHLNIFIEIHGEQHYRLSYFHKLASIKNKTTPEEEFEYQKKKDRMKRKYARKNGIYIEIDLRKIKTTDCAVEYIDKIINSMR